VFTHLHVHSNFSFCRGAEKIETLVVAARRRGYDTLALTDTNGLYGLVWFLSAAREAGLRPIVGAEAVFGEERAVLLAADAQGYAGICGLLTRVHRALDHPAAWDAGEAGEDGLPPMRIRARPPRRRPDPDFTLAQAMTALPPGVVILSPCAPLLDRLARERGARDPGGAPNLYAEIRPGGPPGLRAFARARGLPPVASGAAVFAEPQPWRGTPRPGPGRRRHRLLRAIALNTTVDRVPPGELAPPDAWLAPPDEMMRRVPDLPEAIAHAAAIADRCRFVPQMGRPIFPVYESPEGARLAGAGVADYLEREAEAGIRLRYGSVSDPARRRLDTEMAIIREKGFAPYFLVVRDIVRQAPRTCGRGSAAASLVSYALGITHVDPIRHDLFFERFLNSGRVDPPDIDVDFPWDERDRLLEWVFARFGRARTAMIANQNAFQLRAAVREVAKVRGLSDAEIGRVTGRVPWYSDHENPAELVARHPRFRGLALDPPWPEILQAARALVGFPRHLSVHCGGVVIVPDAVDRHVPVQPSAKGVDVIQWEKDQAEEFGLVKIDLLGNRSLAVIRDAAAAVAARGGEPGGRAADLAADRFSPEDDPDVVAALARGETLGVFYVESPAMRQLQTKCATGTFERLVVHSSIIRPASNEYIREYVRRLRGGSWRSPHPLMDEIMAESFGIMVYQEDVAKITMAMAGFDAAAADDLRKVLSKKHKEKKLADYRDRFYAGAEARGHEREALDAIWAMIRSFAGYSFCKPHSASYAMVSFKSAWLRAHHPADFMAAVISNGGGYYATFAYVSEARRMGLGVRLPDVNASVRAWTGEDGAIRIGLQQLKRLPESAVSALLEERERGGPFAGLEEFLDRTAGRVSPEAVRLLIRAGAFDAVAGGLAARPALMWRLAARRRAGEKARERSRPLWVREEATGPPAGLAPYEEREVLRQEVDALGFLVSRHPLTLFEHEMRALEQARTAAAPLVAGRDLLQQGAGWEGRRIRTVGWFVTAKTVQTKRGEPMEFLSFEDTTALYETTFFPRAYARFCHMIARDRPYVLEGRVEEDFGAVSLNVDAIRVLEPLERPGAPVLYGGGRRAALT